MMNPRVERAMARGLDDWVRHQLSQHGPLTASELLALHRGDDSDRQTEKDLMLIAVARQARGVELCVKAFGGVEVVLFYLSVVQ